MATYIATTAFIPTFLDDNGDPLNGGTLESYIAGTTTPTPTFTGEAGVSAGNIITLNARGEPETSGNTHQVWIDGAIKYDFVLKTAAGVIINSPEDIASPLVGSVASALNIAAAKALTTLPDGQALYIRGYTTAGDGGGGMYVYDASSATAANDGTVLALDTLAGRLLHSETTLITVKTFGAVGDDSTINNSALQSAINSAPADGIVDTGDADDIYQFTLLTINKAITFTGSGVLKGTLSGGKPSRASMTSAGSSAARTTLLTGYYDSLITVTGGEFKGSLSLQDCLLTGTGAVQAKGRVDANNVSINGFELEVEGQWDGAGMIASDSGVHNVEVKTGGQFIDDTLVTVYALEDGIRLHNGGYARCNDGEAWNNSENGIFFHFGGSLIGINFISRSNGNHGVVTNYGGYGEFTNANFSDNLSSGVIAETGAQYYMPSATVTGNGGAGLFAKSGGSIQATSATITGNTSFAVDCRENSSINVDTATIDLTNNSGGVQIRALGGEVRSEAPGTGNKTALTAASLDPPFNTTGKAGSFVGVSDPSEPGNELGGIQWKASTVTIASGSITATVTRQNVDTEGFASSDDLATIVITSTPDILYLFPSSETRTVVIKHGTGNITTTTAADITLDTLNKGVLLIKANTVWLATPLF